MKNRVLAFISATLAVVASASCTKNDYPSYDEIVPNAVVTVKPEGEGSGFYLQLDDNTIIKPVISTTVPFPSSLLARKRATSLPASTLSPPIEAV